jgi:hypothetical protein
MEEEESKHKYEYLIIFLGLSHSIMEFVGIKNIAPYI